MLEDQKIIFLGDGFMASAMIRGIIENALMKPAQIAVIGLSGSAKVTELVHTYGVRAGQKEDITGCDIVFLAFKPQDLAEMCIRDRVQTALIESNHEPALLQSGPYPYYLKTRIASARGHLSNSACAEFCAFLAARGTKRFILAHLSQQNNTPDAAYRATEQALIARGYDAAVECAPVAVS